MTIDLDKIDRILAENKAKRETLDEKAGYCIVHPHKVSAPFADEALKRTAAEANPFLLWYAQLLLETDDWPEIDDKSKIIEWHDTIQAVRHSKSASVNSLTFRYLAIFGRIIGDHKHTESPLFWANLVNDSLKDSKIGRHLHNGFTDPTPEEYAFDYDTDLEKAKEAWKLWSQEHRKHRNID